MDDSFLNIFKETAKAIEIMKPYHDFRYEEILDGQCRRIIVKGGEYIFVAEFILEVYMANMPNEYTINFEKNIQHSYAWVYKNVQYITWDELSSAVQPENNTNNRK